MKRLSVIIVTYQSEHDIYDCLQSVWQHCDLPKEDLEVIVVDNSPESDGMFSQLRQLYGQDIILIHNTHNGGYGQGNNVGISQAKAPVVLIMNPDVRLVEPVFKTAVEAFENDTALCMYGMKQMLSDSVKSPLSFDCSRRMNGYLIPFISAAANKLDCYLKHFMWLQGSCFFIKKEKIEQVGLFDEELFLYGEEDDIQWRLKKKFGPHFEYNKKLHYLHLTLERPVSLATEKKMIDSIVLSNQKKGFTAHWTHKNFVRYYRVRLFSARVRKLLKKHDTDQRIEVFSSVIRLLKHKSHEISISW